jgi:hypothetical protein
MLSKREYAARRKGTAVIELLMIAPLLAMLVVLIFFIGWGSVNVLHVQTADRYAAWKSVYGGGYSADQMNRDFFGNSAVNVDISGGAVPGGTLQSYKDATRTDDAAAGDLLDAFTRYAPGGVGRFVNAQFPAGIGLWDRMQKGPDGTDSGVNRRNSGRDGNEWRWNGGGTTFYRAVIQLYMADVENLTQGIGGQGAPMAQEIRNWYTGGW